MVKIRRGTTNCSRMYAELGSHHNIRILKRINEELVDDKKRRKTLFCLGSSFGVNFFIKRLWKICLLTILITGELDL